MARVHEQTVGRFVWIDFEDIHAIKDIANAGLEAKEEWAIERIIDAFWHTDPDRPVDAADLIGFRKVAEMAERIEQVGGFPAGTAGLFARVLDALEPAPPSREGE